MQHFSQGELDARAELSSNDEIGEVAANFNQMAEKLQQTLASKEALLREVGHELKTPIARGKFALEALQEGRQKQILQHSFDDLEQLTNAILQEKLLDEERLHYQHLKASTLLLNTLSKLTAGEEEIEVEVEDFEIEADPYYLEMAVKNLIENGLKYTEKTPIFLKAKAGEIHIESYGQALAHPLEYYLQPFTQQDRSSQGFGLGLNIVHKILQKHGFDLHYTHQKGRNIFTVEI